MDEEMIHSDLEFFLSLLEHYDNYLLRPIQGSYCRLEIYKDGNLENHSPNNEIRIYFCRGQMNK